MTSKKLFSDDTDTKKTDNEDEEMSMSQVLGLCSGKFENARVCISQIATQYKDNVEQELLGLCSGKFDMTTQKEGSTSNDDSGPGLTGLFGSSVTAASKSEKGGSSKLASLFDKSQSDQDVLGLCSGGFATQKTEDNEKRILGNSSLDKLMDNSQSENLIGLCSGRFESQNSPKEKTEKGKGMF